MAYFCPKYNKKYIYTMYIYSKRHYLSISGLYAWGILGVWLGYPWARGRTALVNELEMTVCSRYDHSKD